MPVLERGGPNKPSAFESADVHRWLLDRAVAKANGGESPRDRVFRLQGDNLELEMAEKRGRLVDADQIEPKMRAAIVAAREGLLRERRRLAALLEGVTDRRRREDIIGHAHETFLRRLATWRDAGEEPDADVDADPAAAEP